MFGLQEGVSGGKGDEHSMVGASGAKVAKKKRLQPLDDFRVFPPNDKEHKWSLCPRIKEKFLTVGDREGSNGGRHRV